MSLLTPPTASQYSEPGGLFVPTKILENDLASSTSEAYECFVNQAFCVNLQAYLTNYVSSVSSEYSVYS